MHRLNEDRITCIVSYIRYAPHIFIVIRSDNIDLRHGGRLLALAPVCGVQMTWL